MGSRNAVARLVLALALGLGRGPAFAASPAREAGEPPSVSVAHSEPIPRDLGGEIYVFDLRRLDLYRVRPDGTDLRRIKVGLGDSEARALNAASAGTAGVGGAVAATGAAIAAGGGITAGLGGTVAAAGGLVALPALGILQAVRVAQRHGREVRSVAQVQPLATVSPGGDRLLLCSDVEGRAEAGHVKLVALVGSERDEAITVRKIGFGGVAPDISPDGRTALLVGPPRKGAASEIHRLDLVTGEHQTLTRDGAGKSFPRWSPDGTSIAFQQLVVDPSGTASFQVFVMPAAGGEARQLTRDALGAVTPSWTPDGEAVVHASLADGSVRRVSLDGSDDRALTGAGLIRLHPRLSPDGSHLMVLQSALEPLGLDGGADLAEARRARGRLGKNFRLRLVRVGDGTEWEIPLSRGDVPGEKVVEKTNLFWFEWRHPPAAG